MLLATRHLDVLANYDHPIAALTRHRLIFELGVALALQDLVLVIARNNDLLRVVGAFGTLLISSWARASKRLQKSPAVVGSGIRSAPSALR